MTATNELKKTRKYSGKTFSLIGSSPTSKKKIEDWADFQRRVNGNKVRIVSVNVKGKKKYTAYIRK